jgi:hypothetical protein
LPLSPQFIKFFRGAVDSAQRLTDKKVPDSQRRRPP